MGAGVQEDSTGDGSRRACTTRVPLLPEEVGKREDGEKMLGCGSSPAGTEMGQVEMGESRERPAMRITVYECLKGMGGEQDETMRPNLRLKVACGADN